MKPTNEIRIAKNALYMYVRMFFLIVINFYASRVVLLNLGITDFGLYNVIGGMVAVEAQAAGLPVICNDAFPKSVDVSCSCFFISTSLLDQWVEKALNECSSRITNREKCVENDAVKYFDIKKSAQKMEEFYACI